MKSKSLIICVLSICLAISSCNKDDSDYIKKSDIMKETGTCKVSISGTTENGYALNETFNLNFGRYNDYTENDSIILFQIDQSSDDININNNIDFKIKYNKLTKKASCGNLYIHYTKLIDSKQMISFDESFYSYYYENNSEMELNNFAFDSSNSKISGKIVLSKIYYNYSGTNKAININVDFNVNVVKVLNKTLNNGNW